MSEEHPCNHCDPVELDGAAQDMEDECIMYTPPIIDVEVPEEFTDEKQPVTFDEERNCYSDEWSGHNTAQTTEAEIPKIQAPYDEATQQLINAGRMSMVKENFMTILAHAIKAVPGNRLEIPTVQEKEMKINLMFDFKPDMLVVFEGELPPEPIIQLASKMPTSATPRLEIKP